MNWLQIIATALFIVPIIASGLIQWYTYGLKKFVPKKWTLIISLYVFFWLLAICLFVIGTLYV